MLTTNVLRSALLLSMASAGLSFSERAFAQCDVAPVGSNAASRIDEGVDPLRTGAPVEPAVDPQVSPAQTLGALSLWLKNWQELAAPRRLPQPFPPQTEKELAYIEELLTFWEGRSAKIQTYRTDFSRWVTDPVFGPAGTFKTFSKGVIWYESPDKALFRVDSTAQRVPPAHRGGKPTYPDMGDAGREQWIWNGKSLIDFDYSPKKIVERQLPPEMHGMPIDEGRLPFVVGPFLCVFDPFPFVFGARKETIQSRYWLRASANKQAQEKGEYWLEAYPKFSDDAVNYTKIEIVIAGADFQTSAIKIRERNNVETIYQFTNRSANQILDLKEAELWRSAFDPGTPAGWERMVEPAPGAAAAASAADAVENPAR